MSETPSIPPEQPLSAPDPILVDSSRPSEDPKEPTPMLDVHPAHHAATTRRDFFIHIATIVLGLLIAIGLEQTVEYFHHRHQVAEVRESLRAEREENRLRFTENTTAFRFVAEELKNNLIVLQELQHHPGTPEEKLPGAIVSDVGFHNHTAAAWKSAQQTGVTALMPRPEVAQTEGVYSMLEAADARADEVWLAFNRINHYAYLDPNLSRLTPPQIQDEISRMEDCMEAAFRWGTALENVSRNFPDFPPGPSQAELAALTNRTRSTEDQSKLDHAQALTNDRLKLARDADRKAQEAFRKAQPSQ